MATSLKIEDGFDVASSALSQDLQLGGMGGGDASADRSSSAGDFTVMGHAAWISVCLKSLPL